ncbi:MAG: hypothetical protein KAI79_18975 [Bacteroidales bacterium]|nr:hypothetical protein [Bacteroidales bacterium]
MENKLYPVDKVIELIEGGKLLSLAGDEKVLSKLPKGNWIAGTIPYFMDVEKGLFNQEQIFVNELSNFEGNFSIKSYNVDTIDNIVKDSYENGYTMLIIPPFKEIHEKYALHAGDINGLYNNPVIGWIAGMDLSSEDVPKTFNGYDLNSYEDEAVVIHVKLPESKFAQVQIVNIFEKNEQSDEIRFLNDGFECEECLINGKKENLFDYISRNKIEIKNPLIADYSGAHINVSFKEVADGKVSFYAPFFKSKTYRFSKSIDNYITKFEQSVPIMDTPIEFSCNCILNYLYGELENKKIKNTIGPITFGEIAYNLLNQTLVYLVISDN